MGARAGTLRRLRIALPDSDEQARIVELGDTCRRARAQRASAISDHDQEGLARVYETAVRAFDAAVAELYAATPEDLAVLAQ